MAEGNWSVIRVEKISAEGAQKTERHNERKNESYANLNVDTEQIARNVHFKDTGGLTYNEYFQRLIDEGKISTRGQKAGATIFNELVVDVNTRYFEEHGGYEYAKQFYEEAYRFGCEIYGEDNIVSAVMHADEINKAVSEELGKPVYHYHLHIVATPTVRKEILWSKRCKDEALRGTVKEVINQVSHSKKWKNTVPLLDESGQQVISKYGKPMFRKSYSVLQDKLFAHMTEAGFTGFERGVLGSTAENLSSLDYQIQKDKERLADIQERIEAEQVRYEPAHEVHKTMAEIEGMGQKTITGKIAVSKDDYQQLTALAKEGITSRSEIQDLKSSVSYYQRQYFNASSAVERLQERYDRLKKNASRSCRHWNTSRSWWRSLWRRSRSFSVSRKRRSARNGRTEQPPEKNNPNTVGAEMIGKDNSFHYYPDFLTSSTLELRRYENERHYKHDYQAPRHPRRERQGLHQGSQLHFVERQCRQAGHPRVASEPRTMRQGYHAHGGRGQKSLRSTQGNL